MVVFNIAVVAVFVAAIAVPFLMWKPGALLADGTSAEPAIQAAVDYTWEYDCGRDTQYAALFVLQAESERAITLAIVRADKRDHGTGTEPRPA